MAHRILRVAALVELASLVILLVNLATVHLPQVATLLGPVHGCAYLLVVGATVSLTRSTASRLLAAVPVVGGVIALRRTSAPAGRDGGERFGTVSS